MIVTPIVMPKDAIVEELGAVKEELARLRESFEDLQSVLEQKNAPRRPGRPGRPGTDKIQTVFDLLKEINPTLPQEKRWAFTKSLLINYLKLNPPATNKFVETHQSEIEQFHRDSGIDPDNHLQNKGNDLNALKKAIWDRTQIVIVHLPLIEAEALLQLGEEGLSQLQKKKKSDDRIEIIDQALTRLDEAIGEATKGNDEERNSSNE